MRREGVVSTAHTQLPLGWMNDLAAAGPIFVSRPVTDAADVIQSG
jgi:hypothetical protein